MEEFILRNGEIAFISEGETKMIMNVPTAFQVLDEIERREAEARKAAEQKRKLAEARATEQMLAEMLKRAQAARSNLEQSTKN